MRISSLLVAVMASCAFATTHVKIDTRDDANVKGPYIAATAPRDNIFAELSADEQASVRTFLEKQKNITIPGDAFFFYEQFWLLMPNKTEATAYLDSDGPKPARYARAFGVHDCYYREYMVGPLPVVESTTATPLVYVNNGTSTMPNVRCSHNHNDTATSRHPSGKKREIRRSEELAKLDRRAPHYPYEEKMKWNGEELPHDDKAAPITILPDGARHEFDPKQNYVSWMDFTFFISTGLSGISLHDIRFKGQRIIYELGMQEALSHYAGPDKEQNEASWLDVTFGFRDFNLIPGYDCPSYATYTDSFCLFEYPKDYPMNRHKTWSNYHATKNIAFLVRSVTTVGNYDYQTTYEFYKDGSIQILVRASGYTQASDNVNATDAWDYGFHIRNDFSGSMHDHVLNFKADLDILGTKNTMFKTEFVPHSQVYDWSDGEVINTMKVERSFITNEDQGKINWSPNAASAYSIVNKDKKNEFGEYPGFRMYPSTGSVTHLTIQNSSVLGRLVDWATNHFYVLRRKDTEPISAHPNAFSETKQTLVDFNSFFNGESLEQEDIVVFFNLGMHHMPDTYDLPNTVFQGAQSGITFRPQNYLRSDNSVSTRQQIDILRKDGVASIEEYGVKKLSGSFDLQSANPSWFPVPAGTVIED